MKIQFSLCFTETQLLAMHKYLHLCILSFPVIDASGTTPTAFVWGNNYMLGSKEACSLIESSSYLPLSSRYQRFNDPDLLSSKPPFGISFIVVYARHESKFQVDMKVYEKVGDIGEDLIFNFRICVHS